MKRAFSAATLALALAACTGDSTGSGGGGTITSVSVSPASPTVAVGATVQLTATATTSDGSTPSNGSFSWNSLDQAVATVNGSGLVTGVATGTARVVAALSGKADTSIVTVSAAGLVTLNVNANSACGSPILRQARVMANSTHAIVMEDASNPTGGFTAAEYQQIADQFDALVWPVNTTVFGTPSDIDGNGKVIILYTSAVNQLTPANAGFIVGGFFYARDVFPKSQCAGSNAAEMFYMLAPDPNGSINGNARSKDYVRNQTVGVVGHEFQHLINASRRLYVVNTPNWDETVWLNEGLSHIAEELLFYSTSGLNPRSNIAITDLTSTQARVDAFNSFGISNFGRIGEYYRLPDSSSPIADDDELSTRGATWQLLRYLADRRGGSEQTFFSNLVNTGNTGTANLAAASGVPSIDPWIRDWGVSVYTDDAVPGVAAQYTQPSWNFRSILSNRAFGNGFPLATQTLISGTPIGVSVTGGSQAYLRFAVAAGQSATIRSAAGGTSVAGACQTTLSLAVGQVFHGTPDNASVVCAPGGAAGQEYVLIPFYGSAAGSAAVSVTGENVVAPVGPPAPDRSPYGLPTLSQSLGSAGGDGGFELRLRERERVELNRVLGRPNRSVAADPVAATVTLTYVRTK